MWVYTEKGAEAALKSGRPNVKPGDQAYIGMRPLGKGPMGDNDIAKAWEKDGYIVWKEDKR